ncbi:MAG: PPOX class F420-dependent oxidoreductase [Acidimicrobiia bacterium]|nr:PPOX class F420-dependent oxidoreductase [Acidimicrobiia bacterium]
MRDAPHLNDEQFLSLETFRRDGTGVKTPIWFAQEGDELFMWTAGDSGKVKRIGNNTGVRVAPCTRFGRVTGDWFEAHASVDASPTAVRRVEDLLKQKLGFRFALFQRIDGIRDNRSGSSRGCLTVSFAESS